MINSNSIPVPFSVNNKKYLALYYPKFIKNEYLHHELFEVRELGETDYTLLTMTFVHEKPLVEVHRSMLGYTKIKTSMVLLEEIKVIIPYVILASTQYME